MNAGAGLGWDLLKISGSLSITSSASAPFSIQVASLDAADLSGSLVEFDPAASYSWTFATASGGITGFDAGDFVIDSSGFTNSHPGGGFSVSQEGNDLVVHYAVPEPSTALLLTTAALGFLARRRRRME